MKKANEISATEAFALVLSSINKLSYHLIDSPDERNRESSDIDCVHAVDSETKRKVAAEHTIVESFEGQLAYVNQSFDIAAEININCQGSIPAEFYYFLAIPDDLVASLDRPRRIDFVKQISPIIAKECAHLQIDGYSKIPFLEYEIWLMCRGSHPEMNGKLYRIPKAPNEGDTLQRQRLARSIAAKLPNLRKYRLKGYSTALLLEDISGGLSNIGIHGQSIRLVHRLSIRLFVDYIVVFASHNQRMIVGNVWKEKRHWYANVPYERKFHFTYDPNGKMLIGT
jgi:hypothetical protein